LDSDTLLQYLVDRGSVKTDQTWVILDEVFAENGIVIQGAA